MINRELFYNKLRGSNLYVRLSQSQVDGIESILNEWESKPTEYLDIRWLAYILATTYHETAKTMGAIEEYGKGSSRPYGRKIKRNKLPYTTPDKIYYGRGKVQLTWYENYELMGRLLNIDLLNNPELALDDKIANKIMFEGMTKGASSFGDFTGRNLEQYFNISKDDPIGARKIINGTDKAELIAHYHNIFLSCLT